MSYWVAFGIGVGVGVVAAVVRRAIMFRPPRRWISITISGSLIFLSGAVVGALIAGSFAGGLLLWLGSLISGVLAPPFLPLPEGERAYNTALEQLHTARRAGDKETVTGFLDSQYTSLRLDAVVIIARRDWREFTPELVRRVGIEEDSDIRESLATALGSFADPATGATLMALLDDDNETVRQSALRGLCRLADPRVPSVAQSMYENGRSSARTAAMWSLLVLGTPEAHATLQGLIATQRSWIRRRQAKAVIRRFRKRVARGKSV